MPRYLIQVRATPMSEAGEFPDDPTLVARMMAFHEELAHAGVLLDCSGLMPSSQGFRVHYSAQGEPTVIDGPFAETKELIAGYTLIQVRSREEAMEWARRFPNPAGRGQEAVIELRQLIELDEFPPSAEIERMKAMDTTLNPR